MTDKTEQSPSPQDDTRTVLQENLIQAALLLLRQTQTEAIALQVPDTKTLIAVGPRVGIAGLLGLAEFVIVDDATATAVRNALVPGPSIGEVLAAKDRTIAELRAALASQSQAAQPTESINTEEFRKLLFTYTEALFGGSEKEQGKRFAALVAHVHAWHVTHIAGTSQATMQAEPSEPGSLNTLLQIADFLDSNSKSQQTGIDTFDYASEFDYNLSHAACTIRSIVADLSEPVASAAKEAPAVPVELAQVQEQVKKGAGFWHTCSGCHESEDGHDNGSYPYSTVLGCKLGMGCSECGGIGAVWDNIDYEAMHAEMDAAPATQEAEIGSVQAAMDKLGGAIKMAVNMLSRDNTPIRIEAAGALLAAFGEVADLAPTTSTVQELPLGALHNGEALANRLENIYDFECKAGPLRNCYEWTELLRCMAAIREWFASTTSTVSAPEEKPVPTLEDIMAREKARRAGLNSAFDTLRTTSTEGGAA